MLPPQIKWEGKIRPKFYFAIFCYTNNLNLLFELFKWYIDKVGKQDYVKRLRKKWSHDLTVTWYKL